MIEFSDNGKEALEAVKKKKYDIILMDCMVSLNFRILMLRF